MRWRAAGGGSFQRQDSQRRWQPPSLMSVSVGLCHGTERKLGIGRRGRWSWEQKRIEGRAQDCFWSEL